MNKIIGADDFITNVVNEYSDTIYRIALNITRNTQDSFDICQEVFVRLVQNRDKIRDDEHLKAWLIRVATNCSRDLMRKAYRRRDIPLESVREQGFLSEPDDFPLSQAVSRLPEKYSTVIYLHYYEDMKIAEIARALKISQAAVKTRLSRGRVKLREILEKENGYV